MTVSGNAASEVLGDLWGFGLPVLCLVFRGLLLPRAAGLVLRSLKMESDSSDRIRGGQLVLTVVAAMSLFFFLNVAGPDLLFVMRNEPGFGTLVGVVGTGLLVLGVMTEWLHRQDNRYTDLLSDANEAEAGQRAARYAQIANLLRLSIAAWVVLFICAVLWLRRISSTR